MTRYSKPKKHLFLYEPDRNYPSLDWWVWKKKWIAIVTVATIVVSGICITGAVFGVNAWQRVLTHESCVNWGIQNDRTSKFVSYQLFNYDCVTKAYDGKWVSIDYPQQFIPLNVNTKAVK